MQRDLEGHGVSPPEAVQVAPVMRVSLKGDNFKLLALFDTPDRNITYTGYGRWEWTVTPTKSGPQSLTIVVQAQIAKDDLPESVVVKTKTITVDVNTMEDAKRFAGEHPEILATLLIPAGGFWGGIAWVMKRREAKRSEELVGERTGPSLRSNVPASPRRRRK
jgi:hypothetical protein